MGLPRDFTIDLLAATPRELGAVGRFIGIIEAPSAALDLSIDGSQSPLRRAAGGSVLVGSPFRRVILQSAVAQTVRVLIADEVQDVSGASAGGATGAVTISEQPSDTVATPADNALAAATTEAIAANAARRRITIGVLSTEVASIRVQAAGAADLSGVEIQPGTSYEFHTTAALDVRNNDAVNATAYWIFEESGP